MKTSLSPQNPVLILNIERNADDYVYAYTESYMFYPTKTKWIVTARIIVELLSHIYSFV